MQFVLTKQAVLFATLFLLLMSTALPARAEFSVIEEFEYCPIPAMPAVAVQTINEQPDSMEGVIRLSVSNPTEYAFPDAYIGLGLYTENQVVPEYVYFLPDPMLVYADSFENITIPFFTQYVDEGEYTVKAFIAQGDRQAVLTRMLRASEDTTGVSFEKTNQASNLNSGVVVETTAQEIVSRGETVQIGFSVENESSLPVLASEYETLVVSGRLPVAAATIEESSESVKLIPGGATSRTVLERPFPIGTYTVYGYLRSGAQFTQLSTEQFVVEEPGIDTYPYIHVVGMSNLGQGEDLSFTTCIEQTSDEYAPAPFQIHLQSENLSYTLDSNEYSAVTVQDSAIRKDSYAVELRKIFDTSRRVDPETGEVLPDSYVPVEQVEVSGLCGEDGCEEVGALEAPEDDNSALQNTYLYLIALLPISLIIFIVVLLFGKKDREDEVEMHKPEV